MQARLLVTGDVQGVGYRAFVDSIARRFQIIGSVRNLPDGSVEVLAEGEPHNILLLYQACVQGPAHAKIESVKLQKNVTFDAGDAFKIVYD
jgi:acylphosphatase